MYEKFFGLHTSPFRANPDPRFLLLTRSAQEALATLFYGVTKRKGFVLLTGEVGTGKTTLINKLLGYLRQQQVATAFVFNSTVNAPQFLDLMTADFGLDCASLSKSRLLLRLNAWLLERYRAGKNAVVIVDEAQNLSAEVLEEIRLLTNFETATEKLLQILLSGQPELNQKLKLPQLRQLNQRIALRCHTEPLIELETVQYIQVRLKIAGSLGRPIFLEEAARAVHRHSMGIPRLINLICEHSLISSYVDKELQISAETVNRIAKELEIEAIITTSPRSTEVLTNLSDVMGQVALLNERLRMIDATTVTKGSDR